MEAEKLMGLGEGASPEAPAGMDRLLAAAREAWESDLAGRCGRLRPLIDRVMAVDGTLGAALDDVTHDLILDALDLGTQLGYTVARTDPRR